jgi:NPCBM/NEW2 domain/Family of unknown function (DUF6298)
MKALRSFSLFLAGFLALAATADAQNHPSPPATTFLSDLTWVSATNGWGPVEKNRSNGETAAGDGRPIRIRGTTYAKGLGVVPASRITYDLGGQYTTFLADVGVDDEVNGLGSVVFQVWVDGVKHYDSAVLTGTSPAKSVRVDVTGKTTLQLVVTDGGDNTHYDHANWANARLLTSAFPLPSGPLSVHPDNPRYFTDGSSRNAIYLTGSHTWNTIQDHSNLALPGGTFTGFLDWLVAHRHNFIRLWMVEHAAARESSLGPGPATIGPLPWLRTGPGKALDDKPKFDLTQFDPAYFDRLRQRAIEAGGRGFYVSVMLFDNWSTGHHDTWAAHPFHPGNNVNGVDGDPNGDGLGPEFHTLKVPAILAIQDEYVKKVVDTVNDLNHVIYEVANEAGNVGALAWQTRVVDLIRAYEASKPKQHLVGVTAGGDDMRNEPLFNSNADWMSPDSVDTDDFDYRENPRPNDGRKVIISDTDHLWGVGGDRGWVWKSFLRGLHPIFMDPLDRDATRESARLAMGDTLVYAKKMSLVAMEPRMDFASTGYSLVNPAGEYLVYQPDTGAFRVTLPAGVYSVEWFNPSTRETLPAATMTVTSTDALSFVPPFAGDAVLYLKLGPGR